VSQSFIFDGESESADRAYDDYISAQRRIIVSGIGNTGSPSSPSTCFNGIAVGATGSGSAVGPTLGGRSKPDLIAPAGATSFSTPLVSGAAAILLEAAARLPRAQRLIAADPRVIKALLLNGAAKPAGWTHSAAMPLDVRSGAGVLNVLESYRGLIGGRRFPSAATTVRPKAAHPPAKTRRRIPARAAWDFGIAGTVAARDAIKHYIFDIAAAEAPTVTLTATLVWERRFRRAAIANLDLFLVNRSSREIVAGSTSRVDNVEHLFVPGLAPGSYEIQVMKRGAGDGPFAFERYALAFAFAGE
jgi:hypothetical protein